MLEISFKFFQVHEIVAIGIHIASQVRNILDTKGNLNILSSYFNEK